MLKRLTRASFDADLAALSDEERAALPRATRMTRSSAHQVQSGGNATLTLGSSAASVYAAGDATLTMSSAASLRAADDANLTMSAAALLTAGGDATLEESAAAVLIADSAQVSSGRVGLLLAREAHFAGDSRVLLTLGQAIGFGLALGLALPFVRYLIQRFFPPPPPPVERPWYVRLGLSLLRPLLTLLLVGGAAYWAYRQARTRVLRVLPRFNS